SIERAARSHTGPSFVRDDSRIFIAPTREREGEYGSLFREPRPDASAKRLHRLTHNAEAETGAFDLAFTMAGPIEPLEQPVALRFRHSQSVVRNLDHHFRVAVSQCLQGAAHLDPRVMLRWIAVLDGVRDEVGEAQLDRGRGDFHVREIVTEPQCYALRCRHLAQLASNFRCCARQPHVPVLSRVGAHHRELEQIVEDSLHTADITDNYRRELATLLVLEIRDLENLPGPKTCTDAISKFMCERAIERS